MYLHEIYTEIKDHDLTNCLKSQLSSWWLLLKMAVVSNNCTCIFCIEYFEHKRLMFVTFWMLYVTFRLKLLLCILPFSKIMDSNFQIMSENVLFVLVLRFPLLFRLFKLTNFKTDETFMVRNSSIQNL